MTYDDDRARCVLCGNVAGDGDLRLVPATFNGRAVNVHADTDLCPGPPDGWGWCFPCGEARPLRDLQFTVAIDGNFPGVGTRATGDPDTAWDTPVAVGRDGRPILRCLDTSSCKERRLGANVRRTPVRDEDTEDQASGADSARLTAVPTDGAGLDRSALSAVWGMKDSATRAAIARYVKDGALRYEEVATAAGGAPRKVYWRVAP